MILAVGESLPLAQQISFAAILGMGKHRALALAGLLENVAMISLAGLLMCNFGVIGMGIALAVPGFFFRGVFPLTFICRQLQLPVSTYLAQAILPAVLAMILPAGGLALLVQQRPPASWFDLVAYGVCFTAAYAGSCVVVFFPQRLLPLARRLFARDIQPTSGRA